MISCVMGYLESAEQCSQAISNRGERISGCSGNSIQEYICLGRVVGAECCAVGAFSPQGSSVLFIGAGVLAVTELPVCAIGVSNIFRQTFRPQGYQQVPDAVSNPLVPLQVVTRGVSIQNDSNDTPRFK